MPTEEQAQQFLEKYVDDEYQLHHADMVATAMQAIAEYLSTDETKFMVTGLIHDWDFAKWPEEHPGHFDILQEELAVDDDIIEAIKGHADLSYPRETTLAKALLACDEFSGLLYAYKQMVGTYGDMKTNSISKKVYKDLNFAAKINREDVQTGIQELGIPEDEFFTLVRDAFAQRYA